MNDNGSDKEGGQENASPRILYCHCAYAKVVPQETKDAVLRELAASGRAFDAVPDLCDLSARKDPALARLAGEGNVKIVACFPRAVKWLFHAGGAPLPESGVSVLNMREEEPAAIVASALGRETA
jgi:hypothetical protein